MIKIIVVDDEIDALKCFLEEIIGEERIEYHFFQRDFAGILSYASHNDFDAAFLDINMPEGSGIDLASALLKGKPQAKIAFVTGLDVRPEDLPESVRSHVIGFLYKPYAASSLLSLLSKIEGRKRLLHAKMFGSFDCFVDGRLVSFSSSKSKELLALLLAYEGKSLAMNDAISRLWPDHNSEKAKILYRDAVWRLRKTLIQVDLPCLEFGRAVIRPLPELIDCDFWNYVRGQEDSSYRGEFCLSYEWAIDFLPFLDRIAMKRQ